MALAEVSPRRFVPDYRVRILRRDLDALELTEPRGAQVLSIISSNDGSFTLNLKAPLLVNLDRRLGRQVVTNDDQPVQYVIEPFQPTLRRSA